MSPRLCRTWERACSRYSAGPVGRQRRAFTIIELLVAATITAVLAGLMLTVVVNVLNSWTRSHGSLEAEAQARLVLDQLATDLQGALYRSDGNVWLAAVAQDGMSFSGRAPVKPRPESLDVSATRGTLPATEQQQVGSARFGSGGLWLAFITARPAGQGTAPVAVSYQIVRRYPPGTPETEVNEHHYLLYRAEVTSADTIAGGYIVDPNGTTAYLGQLKTPNDLQFMADNVVDFGFWLYTREPAGTLKRVFPSVPGETQHLAKAPPSAATVADRFPEVADVMIRVLTAEGVRQVQAIETGKSAADWWAVVTANSKVFTRRIILNASPL